MVKLQNVLCNENLKSPLIYFTGKAAFLDVALGAVCACKGKSSTSNKWRCAGDFWKPQLDWKIHWYSFRTNSTIWFWNTMCIAMLDDSISGRSSVGPNTIATFCTVMRLSSPYWMTLSEEIKQLNESEFSCCWFWPEQFFHSNDFRIILWSIPA